MTHNNTPEVTRLDSFSTTEENHRQGGEAVQLTATVFGSHSCCPNELLGLSATDNDPRNKGAPVICIHKFTTSDLLMCVFTELEAEYEDSFQTAR